MPKDEEGGPSTSPDQACKSCGLVRAKYRCPGCGARSCSLPCVRAHKVRVPGGCSGVRSTTHYVPVREMAQRNTVASDFCFLEEGGRLADNAARDNSQSAAGGVPASRAAHAPGGARSPSPPSATAGEQEPPSLSPGQRRQLLSLCQREGITLHLLPPGMERQRRNRTRVVESSVSTSTATAEISGPISPSTTTATPSPCDAVGRAEQAKPLPGPRNKGRASPKPILWTVEWRFPDVPPEAVGLAVPISMTSVLLHTMPVHGGLVALLSAPAAGPEATSSVPVPALLRHQLARQLGQGLVSGEVEPDVPALCAQLEVLLQLEGLPANVMERTVPIDVQAPLAACLARQTVLEFPTLHVRVRPRPCPE